MLCCHGEPAQRRHKALLESAAVSQRNSLNSYSYCCLEVLPSDSFSCTLGALHARSLTLTGFALKHWVCREIKIFNTPLCVTDVARLTDECI